MNKAILLLKTCLHNYNDIQKIALVLNNHPLIAGWNIDLDDCEQILRVESNELKVTDIIGLLQDTSIWSEELLD